MPDNDGWTDVYVLQVYNLPYAKAPLLLTAAERRSATVAAAGIGIDTYAGQMLTATAG